MKNRHPTQEIKVGLNFGNKTIPVGRLATRDHKIYFAYDSAFIAQAIEISPFRLPLTPELTEFDYEPFAGLPGVFNDSLPDGWGRLLFDRFARSQGIATADITPLDRLAHVGAHGIGALVYEPNHSRNQNIGEKIRLDRLARQVSEVLQGESEEVIQELLALNGSSAGARPKALVGIDHNRSNIIHSTDDLPEGYTPWIVKFATHDDGTDAGTIEYVYALMAKEAGVIMPNIHLFSARHGGGYFAVQRFDRNGKRRLHMHTACGLLHADFRTPSLDYEDLVALTSRLTRDIREVEKIYRLAVFNVLAHNRDDHSKNFSFLMDEHGRWSLSPAYDLTFSAGMGGEHSTMVMGEGRAPGVVHLVKLGGMAGLPVSLISEIIEQTRTALARWTRLAAEYGVRKSNIDLIAKRLAEIA